MTKKQPLTVILNGTVERTEVLGDNEVHVWFALGGVRVNRGCAEAPKQTRYSVSDVVQGLGSFRLKIPDRASCVKLENRDPIEIEYDFDKLPGGHAALIYPDRVTVKRVDGSKIATYYAHIR